MKCFGGGVSNRSKFLMKKLKLKNHTIMRLYELTINDFLVRKVIFGNHFTSFPGSRCQYRQFFPRMVSLNTHRKKIRYCLKKWGVYYMQFVRNTGGVFIRGDAFISGNIVSCPLSLNQYATASLML